MKSSFVLIKILLAFLGVLVSINIYLLLMIHINKKDIQKANQDLKEMSTRANEFKEHVRQSFELFHLPIVDIEKNFNGIINFENQQPIYIIFIPSNACQACISALFSEITENNIYSENLYLISELNDQMLKRLWISYGYNKNKFVADKYNIFTKSGVKDKVVLMKCKGNLFHYDFLLYDLFLEDLLGDYITLY